MPVTCILGRLVTRCTNKMKLIIAATIVRLPGASTVVGIWMRMLPTPKNYETHWILCWVERTTHMLRHLVTVQGIFRCSLWTRQTKLQGRQCLLRFRSLQNRHQQVFHLFEEVTVSEICRLVMAAPNKQCALDPVPMRIVKASCLILAPFLTYIYNRSLSEGYLPPSQKAALVFVHWYWNRIMINVIWKITDRFQI